MAACVNCGVEDALNDEGLCPTCTSALQACPFCGGNASTCTCCESTMGGD